MPLRRKVSALLVMTLLISSIVTACGASTTHHLSPDEIAKQVGIHYGDSQAQVTGVKDAVADGPGQHPMYLISVTGRFHKGALVAVRLDFSALADSMYVWHVYAYDQTGKEIWIDRDLGSASRP
ncbi:MAG TPA: hypothetical protein VF812_04805 [Ktedonobacterales bacterium]